MSIDFSRISLTSTEYESCAYPSGEPESPAQLSKPELAWMHKVRWQFLFKDLFCRSAIVGILLAAFAMPFPAWVVVGVSLLMIAKPDVSRAVADMIITTFVVVALGILWRSMSLVSELNLYVAIVTYVAIAIGIMLAGVILLIAVSSALMAANSKSKFLDISYFPHRLAHIILAGTSILGLSAGYWLIAITGL